MLGCGRIGVCGSWESTFATREERVEHYSRQKKTIETIITNQTSKSLPCDVGAPDSNTRSPRITHRPNRIVHASFQELLPPPPPPMPSKALLEMQSEVANLRELLLYEQNEKIFLQTQVELHIGE
jgi:hypothetical protein